MLFTANYFLTLNRVRTVYLEMSFFRLPLKALVKDEIGYTLEFVILHLNFFYHAIRLLDKHVLLCFEFLFTKSKSNAKSLRKKLLWIDTFDGEELQLDLEKRNGLSTCVHI